MKRPQEPCEAWRDLCADLREEDGIDPRFTESHRPATNNQRVTGRLCKQVERTIQLALTGSADDRLRELEVTTVAPAPDLTRLQVSLACAPTDAQDLETLRDHIAKAAGHLRSEVARQINRKRTPMLAYVLVPAQAAKPVGPGEEVPRP